MKKLILILITFTLFGCEKYELESSLLQQLSAPTPFLLKSYRIQILSGTDKDDIGRFIDSKNSTSSNYVGLCDWNVVNSVNGLYVIQSDTTGIIPQRKYVIGDQWNFGNPNIYGLKIYDNLRGQVKGTCKIYQGGSSSIFTYSNLLTIIDEKTNTTDYGFSGSTNSRGVGYATRLYLTTPTKWAYIKEGNRIIGRFGYTLELEFGRN
jgi:hypothetical protein